MADCCTHCTWSLWKLAASTVTSPAGAPLQVGSYQLQPLTIGYNDGVALNNGLVRTLAEVFALW